MSFERVFLQRNAGMSALLRAVVHEPVFADVQVARACAAAPVVGFAASEIFLEPIQAAVALLSDVLDLSIIAFFPAAYRFDRPLPS